MTAPAPTRPQKTSYRRQVIILLAVSVLLLFAILVSQTAFDQTILQPENNQQTVVFYAIGRSPWSWNADLPCRIR